MSFRCSSSKPLFPFVLLFLPVASVATQATAADVSWFQGVGYTDVSHEDSACLAVSADGSVVVGASEGPDENEAFRWTAGGGIQGLGFFSPSDGMSEATGVSDNGSVIVGSSHDGNGNRAFRWTSGGGMVKLNTFSCFNCDPATAGLAVSGNGLVVVGVGLQRSFGGDPALNSARWPNGGTSIYDLGDLSGPGLVSSAEGASQDGSTIVGQGDSSSGSRAWVWTSGTGMDPLVGVPGAQVGSAALAISGDESTVVGYANTDSASATQFEAVRWTGSSYGTIEVLGPLPGATSNSSRALAVTGDGSLIVGWARNAYAEHAFIWDATNGMRELEQVLEEDYGLDLGGWYLKEAAGISNVNAEGEFTVVGTGTNPSGETEGWVAFLTPPACRDGEDNDLDTNTDYPADAECWGAVDLSELYDCSDGLDNDGDGLVDYPADPECTAADDQTELPDCSDGVDNDGDGLIDHPLDPGCASPAMLIENPACDDGIDNDGDTDIDYPADASCVAADDLSEIADCSDGLDNDEDGLVDYPADPECESASDESEKPQCSDRLDNDGDGLVDYPAAYPDCTSEDDPLELPQCNDGVDNDGDSDIDYPADAGCSSPTGRTENPGSLAEGDLLVVDRLTRAVFRVDPVGGGQSLISEKAFLVEPQGIVQSGIGEVVIADPTGLVEIDWVTGAQRVASPPLVGSSSLQAVFDASGDAFVVEADGISHVAWLPSGVGTKTVFLPVPTPEPIAVLGVLSGGTLAMEADGNLLTTGYSLYGDGVFRIETATLTTSILKQSWAYDDWLDLAVEGDGTILAVGISYTSGPGVYRVDPVDGLPTPLSTGSPWVRPTGVALAPGGEIYVADAGTCNGGGCIGGSVIAVDPVSGTPTVLSTEGYIGGEMDLIVAVPEPGVVTTLLPGAVLLGILGRRRMRS